VFSLERTQWKVRRKRWLNRQSPVTAFDTVLKVAKFLFALVAMHVAAMVWLEDLTLWQAIWLTLTTVTTVGYGDLSASTPAGQVATIVFMYVLGITTMAQLAGEYIEYRLDKRDRMVTGRWEWKAMRDHILIINTPNRDADRYLIRLVTQIRDTPGFEEIPIQILTQDYTDGLPREIREMGVVHRCGIPETVENLKAVNVEEADYVLVLANDFSDHRADCVTLDVLEHIRRFNTDCYIVAEAVLDENKVRFKEYGARSVLRPVRAYPEILVRAIAAPGTEEILENLFTHHDIHAHRYEVRLAQFTWQDIATQIMLKGHGTALGYVDLEGKVVTNPKPAEVVKGKALIVLVDHENLHKTGEVSRSLEQLTVNTRS